LYFGGYLITENFKNGDVPYSGGIIVTIMFCTIFSAMGLGNVTQNMQSITEAKVAGKIAFDTMNHDSEV